MLSQSLTFLKKYQHQARKLSINAFYRGLITCINLISGIVISRDLLEANRGLYNLVFTSIFMSYTIMNLGISSLAIYYAKENFSKLKNIISFNTYLTFGNILILILILFFCKQDFHLQDHSIIYYFLISFFTTSIMNIYKSILIGLDQNTYSQKIESYCRVGFFIFVLYLHITNAMSVNKLLLFLILEHSIQILFYYKKIRLPIFPLFIEYSFIKESFLLNSKIYLTNILGIILLRSDQFIIKKLLNNYNVGTYTVGSTIIENLGIIATMISLMYIPKFISEKDLELSLAKLDKLLRLIGGISILIAILFYFLSPYILEIYFKHPNPEATASLQILLIGFVFWSLYTMVATMYFSIRHKKSLILILAFCVLLNITLNWHFIPLFGIRAAAISSSLTYGILFCLSYFDLIILKRRNFINKKNAI